MVPGGIADAPRSGVLTLELDHPFTSRGIISMDPWTGEVLDVWIPDRRPKAAPRSSDVHVDNQTTLPVEVFVNGERVAGVAPRSDPVAIDPVALPDPPWLVDLRTERGRTLLRLTVQPGEVSTTSGPDGQVRMRGAAARVDLTCGRLDVWVGPPLAGPLPEPGTPGDCEP